MVYFHNISKNLSLPKPIYILENDEPIDDYADGGSEVV